MIEVFKQIMFENRVCAKIGGEVKYRCSMLPCGRNTKIQSLKIYFSVDKKQWDIINNVWHNKSRTWKYVINMNLHGVMMGLGFNPNHRFFQVKL